MINETFKFYSASGHRKVEIETGNPAPSKEEIKMACQKFLSCDWGDVNGQIWQRNDESYKTGGQIYSCYGKRIYIYSEGNY